jgi:sulfur-oxidizing protein SoxB
MDQTCITYPNTYRREMTGDEIKTILEDIADNLFNVDPYYQQGGDMVRIAGIDYTLEPNSTIGKRVSDLRLDDGTKIEASKKYTVSGWASVNSIPDGKPIWDVVTSYLQDKKTVKIKKMNLPKLVGVKDNPGLADYGKV